MADRVPEITDDLTEAVQALHDFRQFVLDNAVCWKTGAAHDNPMWLRVATLLDKHGANDGPGRSFAYYQFDPAYREESRG